MRCRTIGLCRDTRKLKTAYLAIYFEGIGFFLRGFYYNLQCYLIKNEIHTWRKQENAAPFASDGLMKHIKPYRELYILTQ